MHEQAVLAGGCFWCIESAFLKEFGIISTQCGYTGGKTKNPSYEMVCSGTTSHYEAVEVVFDPEKITYLQILEIFWKHIDPFDAGGQFADRGSQYQSAIFYCTTRQKQLAERSKENITQLFKQPVVTEILSLHSFYIAEEKHQAYCITHPQHYQIYSSHHHALLEKIWNGRSLSEDLKDKLTPLQYHVTQEGGTEPPFQNAYWDNKEEGIYVDRISGDLLFLSRDKYDSGTGWPSFTQSINTHLLEERRDLKLSVERTEVRSKKSGSHLGHVFPDGPAPTGKRYCINSASLRFIPRSKMAEEGYASYASLL